MTQYRVKWEMDVEAETAEQAAWHAFSTSASYVVEENKTKIRLSNIAPPVIAGHVVVTDKIKE